MWPNFINMLSWWQWSILAAIPPAIVALYFLKLRREPLEVPSTFLWRKSIEDLHVNSFWQKLRKNLLLLLQLLLVLLIALALLRPSWRSSSLVGHRFVFLIDNSASMSATDVAPTRLANAKRQVRALVEQMASGDKAMLISFAEGAQVVQQYTENRRLLERALERIKPTESSTNLLPALRLAASAAEASQAGTDAAGGASGTLYLFSDGKFPNVEDVVLGNLKPVFVPIGSDEAANIGIIAFNTKRHETDADQVQVFFQLANSGSEDAELDVALFRDNQQVDAKRVKVPAGKQVGEDFPPLRGAQEGILRLEIRHPDPLALDNKAYAVLETPRRGRVLLVTPGNEPVEWALATLEAQLRAEVTVASPAVLTQPSHQRAAAAGNYDLIIYDRCRPTALPRANTLFLGRLPPAATAGKVLAAKQSPVGETKDSPQPAAPPYSLWTKAATAADVPVANLPQVLDTDRNHPLMQLVELGDAFIGSSLLLDLPPGGKTLIETTKGAVAGIAPREGFEDVVIGFEIITAGDDGQRLFNTDWWRKQSFPSFWLNVLSYLGGGAKSQTAISVRPGELVRLRSLSPVKQLEVLTPDARRIEVAQGKSNDFPFTQTDRQGVYAFFEGEQLAGRFAVNLFDAGESDILPRDGLENPIRVGPIEITGSANFEAARQETWKFLLILALVVLLLEWYIYNRRVYI
jgi:hypothetical protein